jgi:hypothetical protein
MTDVNASPKQWHLGDWTGLGWLETIVKVVAHVVAFTCIAWALGGTEFRFWGGVYDLRVLILIFTALGLTAAILDRYLEKEVIAMVFVISNVVAHWGMVFALWHQPGTGGLLTLINYQPQDLLPWQFLPMFAFLMLLGDVVKLVFLLRTNFTVRDLNPRFLVYLTAGSIASYALILILSLSNPPI